LKLENRIEELSNALDDSTSRLAVLELKVDDSCSTWPTPAESQQLERGNKVNLGKAKEKTEDQTRIRNKNKVSFSEKFKSRGKETVLLVGDSMTRGIGSCLEKDSNLFSYETSSGAKIEDIENKLKHLGNKPETHLVVMVGTNNLKSDGSEIMLKKYEKLIGEAKSHQLRKISIVSILSRKDIGDFHNSRRIGVNSRLNGLCTESGVEFVEVSDVRKNLAVDGLHLNVRGQDLVARELFNHCKQHLN
jgi:hypothetical protein